MPSSKAIENAWARDLAREQEEKKLINENEVKKGQEIELNQIISQINELYKTLFEKNKSMSVAEIANLIYEDKLDKNKSLNNPYVYPALQKFKKNSIKLMSLEEKNIGELNKIKEKFITEKFKIIKEMKERERQDKIDELWNNFYFKLLEVYNELIKKEETALEEARKTVEKAFTANNN